MRNQHRRSNNSCKKTIYSNSVDVTFYITLSCVSFLTVLLNLLIIVSISHFRQLHTTTNLLLLSLAVADLLVGLLLMPLQLVNTSGCWYLGTFVCAMFFYLSFILTSSSVGIMVLISIDRYVAICDPLGYPRKITLKRVRVSVCLCWSCSVLYNGAMLHDILENPDMLDSCYGECLFLVDFVSGAVDLGLTFFGPITVIVVLYMRVFVVAVSQARAMRSHITAVSVQGSFRVTAKKSEIKAARTLGVLVVVFLMCFSPYFFTSFTATTESSNTVLLFFGTWFLYCNSCINPIIYAFFYPWFRKAIKLIVSLHILQPDSCDTRIL
uniref:Trace amine-associated receptor 13c-like n=1 Tax=Cynoglossus semilaevis TaxID=244447 RepID=A0A3P8UW46_CYNSE